MGSRDSRLKRLENPRTPRGTRNGRRAVTLQEIAERERQRYETIATEHPERVPDYLEAKAELGRALQEHEEGTREYHDALDDFLEAEQLFEQGWVSGHSCEDCGRAAVHHKETGYEGTCQHCGGVTSYYGYWHKNIIPLEKLEGEITATQRMGYEENAAHLIALMERRLRAKTTNERSGNGSIELTGELASGHLAGTAAPGSLGYLERVKDAKVERIRGNRVLTPESKRLEINETRRTFREEFAKLRQDIIAGYEERRGKLERQVNPPPSNSELERMGLLANVHLRAWERAGGNMVRAAEEFAAQGDRAGLMLVRENAALAPTPGVRETLLKGVSEAEEGLMSQEQKKARNDLRSLDLEKNAFEAATAARPIAKMNAHISPATGTRTPIAGTPQPQR